MRVPAHIRSRRHGARRLRVWLALLAAIGALAVVAVPAVATVVGVTKWEPTAAQWWTVNEPTIMGLMDNGQCTAWAAERRPDIIRRGIEALVATEIAGREPENWGNWTARYWTTWAAHAHIPYGSAPRVGAIAVFQPGVDNADYPTGHVAYVEQVNADGSVRISEMAAPTPGKVTYRTLTRSQANIAGLAYIYR